MSESFKMATYIGRILGGISAVQVMTGCQAVPLPNDEGLRLINLKGSRYQDVAIRYNPVSDLFDLTLTKIRKGVHVKTEYALEVFVGDLKHIVEERTGLYLSL